MQLHYQPYDLQLKHVFKIALYARTFTPLMLIELQHQGLIGYGEASMPQYLGETHETAQSFYKKGIQSGILNKIDLKTVDLQHVMLELDAIAEGNTAAKASIDIALHDLKSKILGIPLWQMMGSDPSAMPVSSFTLGIDTPSVIREKIKDGEDFKILKIKLGSDNDKEIITTIREITDKPLYVDANQGWKDKHEALEMVFWLAERGVKLIEQPMPKADLDGNAFVTEGSPLPIMADESCQRLADLNTIKHAFHGINIKLMKSTGLSEARKMVQKARELGLKVMIGCMSETSCGIYAAAALAPQCDFVDLDTPWLVVNNPFERPTLLNGKIQLSDTPGLGLKLKINL